MLCRIRDKVGQLLGLAAPLSRVSLGPSAPKRSRVLVRIRLSYSFEDKPQRQCPDHAKTDVNRKFDQYGRAVEQGDKVNGHNNVEGKPDEQDNERPAPSGFVTQSHVVFRQSANGSRTRMVSFRSGEVESSATGHAINSSTRRTYLIALAGKSAQLRAPSVLSLQPGISS